jgi:hypothetical protein
MYIYVCISITKLKLEIPNESGDEIYNVARTTTYQQINVA